MTIIIIIKLAANSQRIEFILRGGRLNNGLNVISKRKKKKQNEKNAKRMVQITRTAVHEGRGGEGLLSKKKKNIERGVCAR
jgi:hypothetical protein